MSRPAPPALTVRNDGSARTFAAGNDVVIGRDLRADVRIAHPLISRAHLVLRFDQGRWIAIDNGSLNGMYVNGRRVPTVDLHDGQSINIGNPDGPQLSFEVGRHEGGRPPTTSIPVASRPSGAWPSQQPHTQQPPISRPQPYPTGQQGYPSTQQPRYPSYTGSQQQPTRPPSAVSQQTAQPLSQPALESVTAIGPMAAPRSSEGNLATSMLKILRPGRPADSSAPGSVKIGRNTDNDIVIPDVLASRHHATLVPTGAGTEIRDNRSINGTFVNGSRVEIALLNEGDTVTIGNVDLVFRGGTLVRRTETTAASGTGGLDVHGVTWTIEGNKTLLHNISLTRTARHTDRRDRPVGRGQVHLRAVGGRLHPPDGGHGGLRGPRHPRRVRVAAVPDRDGAAGRRRARPADRGTSTDVRGRAAAAAGHQQRGPSSGSSRRCSRNSR